MAIRIDHSPNLADVGALAFDAARNAEMQRRAEINARLQLQQQQLDDQNQRYREQLVQQGIGNALNLFGRMEQNRLRHEEADLDRQLRQSIFERQSEQEDYRREISARDFSVNQIKDFGTHLATSRWSEDPDTQRKVAELQSMVNAFHLNSASFRKPSQVVDYARRIKEKAEMYGLGERIVPPKSAADAVREATQPALDPDGNAIPGAYWLMEKDDRGDWTPKTLVTAKMERAAEPPSPDPIRLPTFNEMAANPVENETSLNALRREAEKELVDERNREIDAKIAALGAEGSESQRRKLLQQKLTKSSDGEIRSKMVEIQDRKVRMFSPQTPFSPAQAVFNSIFARAPQDQAAPIVDLPPDDSIPFNNPLRPTENINDATPPAAAPVNGAPRPGSAKPKNQLERYIERDNRFFSIPKEKVDSLKQMQKPQQRLESMGYSIDDFRRAHQFVRMAAEKFGGEIPDEAEEDLLAFHEAMTIMLIADPSLVDRLKEKAKKRSSK